MPHIIKRTKHKKTPMWGLWSTIVDAYITDYDYFPYKFLSFDKVLNLYFDKRIGHIREDLQYWENERAKFINANYEEINKFKEKE
jgi:hypothetical protein